MYVNKINNNGEDKADNLKIVNTIPKHLVYIDGSAKGKTKGELEFSVNNGETFDIPKNLYVKKGKKKVKASGEDYTTIRWTIQSLKAKSETQVSYKANLK